MSGFRGWKNSPPTICPTLIRKTGWEWRGDFFDVEIPFSVELHFRFWNDAVERLPAPGTEEFWRRRSRLRLADVELDVLCLPDALAYAGLHFLRHVLRGDTIAFHAYEIARFLDARAEDDRFWERMERAPFAGAAPAGSRGIPLGGRVVRMPYRAGIGAGNGRPARRHRTVVYRICDCPGGIGVQLQ